MRKLLTLLFLAAATMAGMATSAVTVRNSRMPMPVQESTASPNTGFHTTAYSPLTQLPANAAATHTVTVKLIFDPEKYESIRTVRIAGDGFSFGLSWGSFSGDETTGLLTATCELPEGTYTVFTEYACLDSNVMFSTGGYAWIVLEDVAVNSDITLEMKAEDATNKLTYNSVNPDGEAPMLPTTLYTADGMEELEGNITEITIGNDIIDTEYGWIYGRGFTGDFGVIHNNGGRGFDIARISDIRINNVSDRICLTQSRLCAASDGFYFTASEPVYGVKASGEGKYHSDYGTSYEETFLPSPLGKTADKEIFTPFYNCSFSEVTPRYTSSSRSITSPTGKLQCAGIDNIPTDLYCLRFNIDYADYGKKVYDEETGEEIGIMTYASRTQPLRFDADGNPVRDFVQLINDYSNTSEMSHNYSPVQEHPAFSYPLAQCLNRHGDSQPSLLLESRKQFDWETEKKVWYIDYLPFGRLGEFRISDMLTADVTQKDLANGDFEYRVTVKNNIVDNIEGATTAILRMNPEKDICPPAVQMVQFRNTSGQVTDRFAQAEEGKMLIAAGDFNQKSDPENDSWWWYEVEPVTARITCAPHGTENWQEITVTERPEWFVKEFGHLFEGSLSPLSDSDYKGWYDLRILLTDKDGSTQQQTISPAFKIGEGTGSVTTPNINTQPLLITNDIATAGGDTLIEAYAANGNLIASGHGQLNLATLQHSLYIIRAGSQTAKHIVR